MQYALIVFVTAYRCNILPERNSPHDTEHAVRHEILSETSRSLCVSCPQPNSNSYQLCSLDELPDGRMIITPNWSGWSTAPWSLQSKSSYYLTLFFFIAGRILLGLGWVHGLSWQQNQPLMSLSISVVSLSISAVSLSISIVSLSICWTFFFKSVAVSYQCEGLI